MGDCESCYYKKFFSDGLDFYDEIKSPDSDVVFLTHQVKELHSSMIGIASTLVDVQIRLGQLENK